MKTSTRSLTVAAVIVLGFSDYDTDQMRIGAFSCAQMGWPVPDQCTSGAILTTSY